MKSAAASVQAGPHDEAAPTPLQLLALEIDCRLHQVWGEIGKVISEDDLPVVAAALRVAYAIGRDEGAGARSKAAREPVV